MFDADAILAKYGLAPEREPVPVAPLFTARAERIRDALLNNLGEAAAAIGALQSTVLHAPFNEVAIGAHVEATRNALTSADAGLKALGDVLGCRGEA